MKITNWWEALCDFIEANRDRPLAWGSWDCCQFAAEAVLIMTRTDYRAQFPVYANQAAAFAIVESAGSMEALLTSILGPAKPVARAKRGDIVAINAGFGVAAGVCLGVMCASVGVERLQFLRTERAVAAWTIE